MAKRQQKARARSRKARTPRRASKPKPQIAIELLAQQMAGELTAILQRKVVRDLLFKMVSEEDSQEGRRFRGKRSTFDAVLDDHLSATNWTCWWYKFYLNVIKPLYGFTQIEAVKGQKGDVVEIENGGNPSEDGDFTFNITNLDPPRSYKGKEFSTLHCEITPCNRVELQTFIDTLNTATLPKRVSLDGTLSFDPAHDGGVDVLEVHPIVAATLL
jgi:signal peptidase I